MEIKKTKNYSIFKFDSTKNRAINYPHLSRLKDAISKNNLLSDNPIVVPTSYYSYQATPTPGVGFEFEPMP